MKVLQVAGEVKRSMMGGGRPWLFPTGIFVTSCVGIFVVPFLVPPPYLAAISVANVAGYNNKVAAVVAASLSVFVFFVSLRRSDKGSQQAQTGDYRRLSLHFTIITVACFSSIFALLSFLIYNSHLRYPGDAGYFIEQLGKHTEYGRELYAEIEFPYGPLTFYAPSLMRLFLFPLHLSARGAYFLTLLVEYVIGLGLISYVIDNLPMPRKWKMLMLLLCSLATIHLSFGLNYSPFRFVVGGAFLVLVTNRKQAWAAGLWILMGEIVCLAVSPEVGFAFGASSIAYAIYRVVLEGRCWLVAIAAPFAATAVFLLLAGMEYLLMLKLFAAGVFNFVVEPLPHILVFLFALIWLVPSGLALSFRQRRPEAPMLATLYVFVLALLPVSLGRADVGHVLFNGLLLYLLSMVAVSSFKRRRQLTWAICLFEFFLFATFVDANVYEGEWLVALPYGLVHHETKHLLRGFVTLVRTHSIAAAARQIEVVSGDHSFDAKALQAITGSAPVALPLEVPLYVEEEIKRSGQYVPLFYAAPIGVYDAAAEERQIRDLNQSTWALLPRNAHVRISESPSDIRFAMGLQLTYKARHAPYVIGARFDENMRLRWQPYGEVGLYDVYRRR